MDTGSIPNNIPHAVAAPFPPLKPAKMGNIWPMTAETPQAILKKDSTSQFGGAKGPLNQTKATLLNQNELAKPFIKSNTKTVIPKGTPSTRKVLVVPALPLPCSRTSTPLNPFPTQIAEGIEPKI